MLKNTLILNALFSLANTVAMLLFTPMMAGFLLASEFTLFGISAENILRILAIGLFGFAAYVAIVAIKLPQYLAHTKLIIAADSLWVASTILLFILASDTFTKSGILYFSVVGFIVAAFAISQVKFLKTEQHK